MAFVPLAEVHQKSGATALIAAMLNRAMEDVRAGDRLRTQALAWVCDPEAKERLGSFEWCCRSLNLDVDAVRAQIRQQSVEDGHDERLDSLQGSCLTTGNGACGVTPTRSAT